MSNQELMKQKLEAAGKTSIPYRVSQHIWTLEAARVFSTEGIDHAKAIEWYVKAYTHYRDGGMAEDLARFRAVAIVYYEAYTALYASRKQP